MSRPGTMRLTVGSMVVLVAMAAGGGIAQAQEEPAGEPVSIMLSYIPSVQFFPPLVAEGLGYFDEEGLDVSIQPSEGSSFVVQQVAGGNVPMGLPASQSVVLGFDQSPNFKVVYEFSEPSFGIYVPEDSPVQTVADLKGKTIGTPDLAGGEALSLRIQLEQAGLQVGPDVTVEALGYNEPGMAEAVDQGRVDALSIYWSTSAIADHAGIDLRCITCESGDQVGMAVVTSDQYLADHRDAVVGALRAMAKATLFAQTNPEAAVDVLTVVNPEGSTDIDQLRTSLDVAIEAIAPEEGQPYGANSLEAWQALVDGMLLPGAQSGLARPIDVSALVDDSLIAEVNDFDHDAVRQQAQEYATEEPAAS